MCWWFCFVSGVGFVGILGNVVMMRNWVDNMWVCYLYWVFLWYECSCGEEDRICWFVGFIVWWVVKLVFWVGYYLMLIYSWLWIGNFDWYEIVWIYDVGLRCYY